MLQSRGKVPHFSMRPHPLVTMALCLVLIVGLLLALSFFHKEDGTGGYKQHGILVLMVTAVLTICLSIIATSKFWFSHLWKRNSTHARHHQHTDHHPEVRRQKFRKEL